MRAFMLLPATGGLRQVELDFARADIDREIEALRRLFGQRKPPAQSLDTTLDAEVEKLRVTHSEMAAALGEQASDASGSAPFSPASKRA